MRELQFLRLTAGIYPHARFFDGNPSKTFLT
jgi:hypothetical protein